MNKDLIVIESIETKKSPVTSQNAVIPTLDSALLPSS